MRAEVDWSPMREDIKRKLEANWALNERLNNKEEINQERHRLEELAQRLVEEIKEKLI
ncbi:35229_t:CDS:2 [Gigaspora margarita]|uniref:35229_t:CDS:1 n=1 Tax=Gigaspora margarita TaxID=4874 RepID=A0ABN7UV53_GIGMA|nr:35229_t:CDS:2 [Gigaspora margarita]